MPEETAEIEWDDVETFLSERCRDELNLIGELYPKKQSILIDFQELQEFSPVLAERLLNSPDEVLKEFNRSLEKEKEHIGFAHPMAKGEEPRLSVRFCNVHSERELMVRECNSHYLGQLFALQGLVTKVTDVLPRVWKGVFMCKRCQSEVESIQSEKGLKTPLACEQCGRKDFELVLEKSKFIDFQKIEVQEPLEILKGGDQAKRISVWLEDDLTNRVLPGQKIIIGGSLRLEAPKTKGTVYQKFVEANNIEFTEQEFEELEISDEEEKRIKELSKDPKIVEKFVASVAPSIYGHTEAKEAVALQLCGGTSNKRLPDGMRIRDNIHILLIGDPGTAKSQMLKYVDRLAPKSLYVSGKSATGGGLTAIAEKDEFGEGGWVLKAGALVLASGGLACLHPDSKVTLADRITEISSLFDEEASFEARSGNQTVEISEVKTELPVWGLEGGEVRNSTSTKVRRKEYSGKMLEIRLSSGNALKITPEHRLIDGDTLLWKQGHEFKKGDLLLAPLKLPGFNERQYIMDFVPEDWAVSLSKDEKEELKARVLESYATLAEFNREFSLDKDVLSGSKQMSLGKFKEILDSLGLSDRWKRRSLNYARRFGGKRLALGTINEDMCYLFGFIYGDGHVKSDKRRGSFQIVQSTKNEDQTRRIKECWARVFGEEAKPYRRVTESIIRGRRTRSECLTFHKSNSVFVHLYDTFTGKNLGNLLRLSDRNLAAFVAGALDSDGCVSVKTCKKNGKAYEQCHANFLLSNSAEESLNFATALRRFDCLAKVIDRGNIKDVVLSSRNDVKALMDVLKPHSCKAGVIVPSRKNKVSGESDKMPAKPVSQMCSQLIQGNASTFVKQGVWSNAYNYSKCLLRPSREQFRRITDSINLPEELRAEAENLLRRDYFLDEIKEIKETHYEGCVYDLFVPKEHNFVADGCFVHNCIDEFDKMSEEDRSAIHEALEQQTVSVAKAGIIATFKSESAVLAAANPKYSRFDPYKTPAEQFDIPPTLISRFDLIFPIKDVLDEARDKDLASHILGRHKLSQQIASRKEGEKEIVDKQAPPIEEDLLKKYIAYSRRNCRPVLTDEAIKRLQDYYVDLRKRSSGGSVPLTPRQLEGLVRLAEASAKLHLRQKVEMSDADRAIRLVEFVLREVGMEKEGGGFDIDRIVTDHPKSERDRIYTITGIVKGLEDEYDMVPLSKVLEEAQEFHNIDNRAADKIIRELINKGDLYEPRHGHVKTVSK